MDIIIDQPTTVFEYLMAIHDMLPSSIRYLIYISFGGMILIAILRSIGR